VARGAWRRWRGRPRQRVDIDAHSVFLGTDYGGYAVLPNLLAPGALVYSAGIGEDISFDLAVIERFGCIVHGFDPTPRSLAWLQTQNLPEAYLVHPFGLASFDGKASFAPPKNPAHVSHSIAAEGSGERVEFPVRRLATVLRELGHERLDILKLDIEGSEYDVLDDLLSGGQLPTQLLVEFHHGTGDLTVDHTEQSLRKLGTAGYRVFDARDSGKEFSLVLEVALGVSDASRPSEHRV